MRHPLRLLLLSLPLCFCTNLAFADALAKITAEKLEATHKAVEALKAARQEIPRPGPYQDFRANMHVHSAFSHDSRGKIEDIVGAAKKVNTRVLMFTEHPSEKYDYFKDGHRGIRDGVLLIPGAETEGFLVFPTQSMKGVVPKQPQEFSDLVRGRGGLTFVSHLEERMKWDIQGVTGNEIYNTHANFKDQKQLIQALRNPLWIFKTAELIRKYPQETFSALQEYPKDYLRRWDELCKEAPHTGVAANDSHQNVGITARAGEGTKIIIEDALAEKVAEVDAMKVPLLAPLLLGKKPGDVIFQVRLDPYAYSLGHVGTHLLLSDLNEKSVWDALQEGRAFVAFDWMADSTGFDFAAHVGDKRHEMGSRFPLEGEILLKAQAPLPVHWKLLRDGKIVKESDGSKFELATKELGIYRIEAWLDVAGEPMIWVLSNPIYVRPLTK
ncbi:MAG TPA: PHP domain-containing protein [Gemmataceae bacterium]|nr:PHP domain-containing protein [Gemmataceae bacterium]